MTRSQVKEAMIVHLHMLNQLRFRLISDVMEDRPYFSSSPRKPFYPDALQALRSTFTLRQHALQKTFLHLLTESAKFLKPTDIGYGVDFSSAELGDDFPWRNQFAIINAGLPCSGKTVGMPYELLPKNTVILDPDNVEANLVAANDSEDTYYQLSSLAREITMEQVNKAVNDKYSFIYETTLTDFPQINSVIERLVANDADIFICYTDIKCETSIARDRAVNQTLKHKKSYLTTKEAVEAYNYSVPTFLELKKRYEYQGDFSFRVCDNNVDFEDPILVVTKFNTPQSLDILGSKFSG